LNAASPKCGSRYGHAAGDAVVRDAAARIRDACRISDIVGRYGGEEFVVLMPETGGEAAVAAADKLRALLAETPVEAGATSIPVRASIGAAAWHAGMRSASDLYAAADEALYRAKELGRARTELYVPRSARP
jgi:two-component system cell cycle response regulator